MMIPFHERQLQFMVDLVSYRSQFFNPLFMALNYVDTMYFVFLIVPFIWVGFSFRWGIRLFYLMLISMLINTSLKLFFGWPRPCHDLAELGLYQLKSFGFPSGGAQNSVLLGGLIAYYWKYKYAVVLGVLYALLISFSRLYLGVHYPVDVLGGWIIGGTLLFLFIKTIDPIEKFLKKRRLLFSFFLSELIPLGLFFCVSSVVYHRVDAMAVGLGIYLSLKYGLYLPTPEKVSTGIYRGLIAVAGVYILFLTLRFLPVYAYYGTISLWLALFASPFCRWILRLKKAR